MAGDWKFLRVRVGSICVSKALMTVSLFGLIGLGNVTRVLAQQAGHGVSIFKECAGPVCVGEATRCDISIAHADIFGDTTRIMGAFDTVDPLPGSNIRVPAVGNLPIVNVFGNTTCTVGGSLPCLIGPAGSTQSGLPGAPFAGVVTFRSEYVVQADDPSPLPDRASVQVQDLCDSPITQNCSSALTSTVQFTAKTPVLDCSDPDSCTTDCCIPWDRSDPSPANWVPAHCTNASVCTDDSCAAGDTPLSCEDGLACTIDACDDSSPTCCVQAPLCPPPGAPSDVECCADDPTACEDLNACTTDACVGGDCCHHDPVVCTPPPVCFTRGPCDPATGCPPIASVCPDPTRCNDNNVCTSDVCDDTRTTSSPQLCCRYTAIPCAPTDVCHTRGPCHPITGCPPAVSVCPDPARCNDSNACTTDICDDTALTTGCCRNVPVVCPTPDACHRQGPCLPASGCPPQTSVCDDPTFSCDDGNPCTLDECDDSALGTGCCIHTPIVCPPAPVCFRQDACSPATSDPAEPCPDEVLDCRTGTLPVCCPDDGNPCTHEFCDQATGLCGRTRDCTVPSDCTDDGLACTIDTCVNFCCGDVALCPPGVVCCADGASCDDGDDCTGDSCVNGCCSNTVCDDPTVCDDDDDCTTDRCIDDFNPATPCCENLPLAECCCGNGIVEEECGETCDPPGSVTPDGTCSEICRFCGDGVLDPGEECEVGIDCLGLDKPCKDTICNPDTCLCVKDPEPDGTIVPSDEFCMDFRCEDGMAFEHPKPAGVACGATAPEGVCDLADTCDGFGHCNSNYKEASAICRPAVNVCDVAERCSGLNPGCPTNRFAPSGTPAADDGLACTYDVCNGQGAAVHPPKPWGTPCGNQAIGICDQPDRCDGAGTCDMNLVVGNNCMPKRLAKLAACMRGPNLPYPDPSCFTVDMDQDGDVDHHDCHVMME